MSGTISCWQAAYNNAYYNQGAPKPDGSNPGFTSTGVTGTYDKASGKIVLGWAGIIVGGAFNNFGGSWHWKARSRASDPRRRLLDRGAVTGMPNAAARLPLG